MILLEKCFNKVRDSELTKRDLHENSYSHSYSGETYSPCQAKRHFDVFFLIHHLPVFLSKFSFNNSHFSEDNRERWGSISNSSLPIAPFMENCFFRWMARLAIFLWIESKASMSYSPMPSTTWICLSSNFTASQRLTNYSTVKFLSSLFSP